MTAIAIIVLAAQGRAQLYKDSNAVVQDRLNDLMQRMTLEEKVEQVCMTGIRDFFRESAVYGVIEVRSSNWNR